MKLAAQKTLGFRTAALFFFLVFAFTIKVEAIGKRKVTDEENDELLTASDYFSVGNELYSKGDYPGAISHYQAALNLDSRFPDCQCNLGSVLMDIGDYEGAVEAYIAALELEPTHADANYNFAMLLQDGGANENAIYHYKKTVESDPDYFEAWANLGGLQLLIGDQAGAVKSLGEALELAESDPNGAAAAAPQLGSALAALDPERCMFGSCPEHAAEAFRKALRYQPGHIQADHALKAVLADPTVETASTDYVKSLFNDYAETFDSSLSGLEYKAPELISQTMHKLLNAAGKKTFNTVVDAGCGTGLIGPLFEGISRKLIGIDISDGMLQKAKERGMYASLREGDIVAELKDIKLDSDDGKLTDLVVAADVLVYIGNLEAFFEASAELLQSSGYLAFTTERVDNPLDGDWKLQPSGRFAHKKSYVDQLALRNGLTAAEYFEMTPRLEGGKPIAGQLFVFQKA